MDPHGESVIGDSETGDRGTAVTPKQSFRVAIAALPAAVLRLDPELELSNLRISATGEAV